ncbi:MAG: divalent-cation tolerance protein CutA [Planctomycetota bacterium]
MADPVYVVLCTVPTRDLALELARTVVDERLAGCVQVLPGLTSVYRWNDAVQQDDEVLMVLKAPAARLEALEARLVALHPYDVPEFVALRADRVALQYASWLDSSTR